MTAILSSSARAVLDALVMASGPLPPGALAAGTGLAARTVSGALRELRDAGLVEGGQREARPTLAGRAAAARALPVPAGSWDAALGELLPVWHAAAARLMADAVTARAVGPASGPPLPGFVIFGPPASFKSSLGELVVEMFGLDRARSVVANSGDLSPGAVLGRRQQTEGGWRFEASGYLEVPFVVFDELADADRAVIREVTTLLYGERERLMEGEVVRLAPVVLACFNPPRNAPGGMGVLSEGTWRRVLRLNTAPVASTLPAGLGRRLGVFLAGAHPAPLQLASMTWPALGLGEQEMSLWDNVESLLSEKGRAWHDARVFETLSLARAARHAHRGEEMVTDAFGVALDVLVLAETVDGLVAEVDWRPNLDAQRAVLGGLPGGAEALAAVAARQAWRAALDEQARSATLKGETLSVELVGARAELGERYRQAAAAITRVPAGQRPTAAKLRAQLRDLAKKAGEARSAERLADLEAAGAAVVERAERLAGDIAEERTRAARQAEADKLAESQQTAQRKQADRLARDAEDERAKARKEWDAERKAALGRLNRLAARKATRRDEDVTARLVAEGCVQQEVVERQVRAGLLGKRIETRRRLAYRDRAGELWWPEQLSEWATPPVLAVIAARRAELVGAGGASSQPGIMPTLGPAPTLRALPAAAGPYTAESIYGPVFRNAGTRNVEST